MTDKRRRQCKVKGRAAIRVILRPETSAMRLDDGAANGKSHAQAVPLGGVERLENFVDAFRSRDRCRGRGPRLSPFRYRLTRLYRDLTLAWRTILHRIKRVQK